MVCTQVSESLQEKVHRCPRPYGPAAGTADGLPLLAAPASASLFATCLHKAQRTREH